MILNLTDHELWAMRDWIRQHAAYGEVWSTETMRRIHAALLLSEANPNRTADLELSEEECWRIDAQIPSALMVGTQLVGRSLIRKAMVALAEAERANEPLTEEAEQVQTEVPRSVSAAFHGEGTPEDFAAWLVAKGVE